MKRHGALFERIAAFDNLDLAYRKAAKGRRCDPAVLRFHDRLEENLLALHNELMWQSYCPGSYYTFTIYAPKERVIYAAPFRDRVVHHAMMNIISPIWDGLFFSGSYACRTNKGVHAGLDKVTAMLQSCRDIWGDNTYVLQADVAKFFPSINHHILMAIIRRKIKCRRTLELLDKIIFIDGDRGDMDSHNLPIGNLISQWCANLYLNELDQFIKRDLGVRHYIRYMDDFVLLHESKAQLHQYKTAIEHFLHEHLHLDFNPKTSIYPAAQGIDILGFRVWHDHRLLRKSSAKRMCARLRYMRTRHANGELPLKKISQRIASWLAHCQHCNSWRLRKRIMRGAAFSRSKNLD